MIRTSVEIFCDADMSVEAARVSVPSTFTGLHQIGRVGKLLRSADLVRFEPAAAPDRLVAWVMTREWASMPPATLPRGTTIFFGA